MALARIELLAGRTPADKRGMIDAVRAALSESLRAPENDPAVALVEHAPEHFSLPHADRHSDRYTLVEVTMFAGRSMDTKRRLYKAIVSGLSRFDVPPGDVLIVLHEPAMENWAIEGGRPASEVDVGFKVEI